MAISMRRAGLFVFLISASSAAGAVTLPPATAHVPLGATGTIEDNKVYSVDGTPLRFMVKDAMRMTPISGGHVWRGLLTVCDAPATCTELNLSGPDQPPGEWHGFKFTLVFVVPTSLTIARK
jgi:hypothetical protein